MNDIAAFGAVYALHWIAVRAPGQAASAGVVMAAALPVIIGVQLLLQAMNFDVVNVPTRPIHPYLRTLERIEAAAHAEAEAAARAKDFQRAGRAGLEGFLMAVDDGLRQAELGTATQQR